MIWWGLLLRCEALLARQPAFWILGLLLALATGFPSYVLPLEWRSQAHWVSALLTLLIVPRAAVASIIEADRMDTGATPQKFNEVWQAGRLRAGPARWIFLVMVLFALPLGSADPTILLGSLVLPLVQVTFGRLTLPVLSSVENPFLPTAGTILAILWVAAGTILFNLSLQASATDWLSGRLALRAAWRILWQHPRATLGILLLGVAVDGLGQGLQSAVEVVTRLPASAPGIGVELSAPLVLSTGLFWLVRTLTGAPFILAQLLLWTLFYRRIAAPPIQEPTVQILDLNSEPIPPLPIAPDFIRAPEPVGAVNWRRLSIIGVGAAVVVLATLSLQQVSAMERAAERIADITAQVIIEQPNWISRLTLSPDDRTLATCTDDPRASNHTVQLWPLGTSGTLALEWDNRAHTGCDAVAFSPDGHFLLAGFQDGAVRMWDLTQRSPRSQVIYTAPSPVEALAFSPNGQQVAIGTTLPGVVLLNPHQGTFKPTSVGDEFGGTIAWRPDGQMLAVAGGHGLEVWDVGGGDQDAHSQNRKWDNVDLFSGLDRRWHADSYGRDESHPR